MSIEIILGDSAVELRGLPDNSVDSVVTDPPYGLSFMGKKWDYDVPTTELWAECLRILKPGGHLLAFAGTRTQHRMAVRIEDAGFEIRDMIAWVYGSGFPKSLDVSKAIDKAAGVEREVVGERKKLQSYGSGVNDVYGDGPNKGGVQLITAPATDAAKQWSGWGTALKPALEPITVARKPLVGTVAENVLRWGTGGLNIDWGRVPHLDEADRAAATPQGSVTGKSGALAGKTQHDGERSEFERPDTSGGRFPANLIHDGSDEVTEPLGEAARFFYCSKASRRERGEGNGHPTVKPVELMRYLVRLVTPPGGLVLDPFMGSGTTGVACVLEGFGFVGIEREEEHATVAARRIEGTEV